DAGLVVLTAFISPHRAERQMVRERLGEGRFIEVFVDTPLAICGAWRKGKVGVVTGLYATFYSFLKYFKAWYAHQDKPESAADK
ncbi:adenylyl-sulfate kinase, partial [Klebsiella michiganensis]|uniref:adenylyl-sulfate kinase n=1 Tax=Klebsiella michiganensis TaxID=1134687 RepID=UPI001E4A4A3D